MIFEVLKAANVNSAGTYIPYSFLEMEAAGSYEILVPFYMAPYP
jgi:hypothetical protein